MTLETRLSLGLIARLSAALDLSTALDELNYPKLYQWSSGTGANQADLRWHDRRTLAASASEDLDLAGGLTDSFGAAITFARIKAMLVYAVTGNTNNVHVGGAGANGFVNWIGVNTTTVRVRPGGLMLFVAPDSTAYAVTAGTGDLLRVANSAGGSSVTYEIALIGSSA